MQSNSPPKLIQQIYPSQVIANRLTPQPHDVNPTRVSLKQQQSHYLPRQQNVQYASNMGIPPPAVVPQIVYSQRIEQRVKPSNQPEIIKVSRNLNQNPPVALKQQNLSTVDSHRIPLGLGLPQLPSLIMDQRIKAQPEIKQTQTQNDGCTFCRVIPWILAMLLFLALLALILFIIFFRHLHIKQSFIPLCSLGITKCGIDDKSQPNIGLVTPLSENLQPLINKQPQNSTGGTLNIVNSSNIRNPSKIDAAAKIENSSKIETPSKIENSSRIETPSNVKTPSIMFVPSNIETSSSVGTGGIGSASSEIKPLSIDTIPKVVNQSTLITQKIQNSSNIGASSIAGAPSSIQMTSTNSSPSNMGVPSGASAQQNIGILPNVFIPSNSPSPLNIRDTLGTGTSFSKVGVQKDPNSQNLGTTTFPNTVIFKVPETNNPYQSLQAPQTKPKPVEMSLITSQELFNLQDHSNYPYLHLRKTKHAS